ncbi:MAG: endolytic transglycosylase MltG [Saprospiraceae bacterium]
MYKGLPPGPISMASISSIDAVLNPDKHHYLYFCARRMTPAHMYLQKPFLPTR